MLQQTCFFNIAVKTGISLWASGFLANVCHMTKGSQVRLLQMIFVEKKAKLPEEKNSEIGIFRQ
jgi:hypothetical protein